MARHWFGQSPTDWTMTLGTPVDDGGVKTAPVSAMGPVTVTFWSAASGGTQYTDLLDASGNAITEVVTSDGTDGLAVGTIPRFRGPDQDPEVMEMWADAGGGVRYLMVATDLGAYVNNLRDRVANLESTVEQLTNSLGAIVYDSGWPERPADDRPYIWIGPVAPPVTAGDLWADTQP